MRSEMEPELIKDLVFAIILILLATCWPPMREAFKEAYVKLAAKNGHINAIGGMTGLFLLFCLFDLGFVHLLRVFIIWLFTR